MTIIHINKAHVFRYYFLERAAVASYSPLRKNIDCRRKRGISEVLLLNGKV